MELYIKAKPNSRKNAITKIDENHWQVETTSPPVDNKANKKVIELIADDLKVAKSRIIVKKGANTKNKILEII